MQISLCAFSPLRLACLNPGPHSLHQTASRLENKTSFHLVPPQINICDMSLPLSPNIIIYHINQPSYILESKLSRVEDHSTCSHQHKKREEVCKCADGDHSSQLLPSSPLAATFKVCYLLLQGTSQEDILNFTITSRLSTINLEIFAVKIFRSQS